MAEKKLNFKPIGINLLVKPEEAETKTKSGIVLMTKDEERPQKGTVVALGTGGFYNGQELKFSVKEGDKVYFKKFGGHELELEGEKFLIMTENDLLGVLK